MDCLLPSANERGALPHLRKSLPLHTSVGKKRGGERFVMVIWLSHDNKGVAYKFTVPFYVFPTWCHSCIHFCIVKVGLISFTIIFILHLSCNLIQTYVIPHLALHLYKSRYPLLVRLVPVLRTKIKLSIRWINLSIACLAFAEGSNLKVASVYCWSDFRFRFQILKDTEHQVSLCMSELGPTSPPGPCGY